MSDPNALANYYSTRTDAELLNLMVEGGFTQEAERMLSDELRRRGLGADDLKRYVARGEQLKLRDEASEKGYTSRGTGLLFFGKRYISEEDREENIQIRTKWFALCWLPLVPIASYRFQCRGNARRGFSDDRHRVINRVPLDWTQVFLTWLKAALIVVLIILIGAAISWYRGRLQTARQPTNYPLDEFGLVTPCTSITG